MAITDFFSGLMASVGLQEVHAEAPAEEEENQDEGGDEGGEEKPEEVGAGEDTEAEEGAEEEEAEAEAEEEEEDEPVDPKPKLEEECARSAQCAPYRHHFEECVERVTAKEADPDFKGPKEDCVEEYFHLQHCATACAAPKLFRILK